MIVRYSLCGCIRHRSSFEDEPLNIKELLEFTNRIKEHYKSREICRFNHYKNIVVRDIVKRGREDD